MNCKNEIYPVHRDGTMRCLGFSGEFIKDITPEVNLAEQVRIMKEDRMGIRLSMGFQSKQRQETADLVGSRGTITSPVLSKCKL